MVLYFRTHCMLEAYLYSWSEGGHHLCKCINVPGTHCSRILITLLLKVKVFLYLGLTPIQSCGQHIEVLCYCLLVRVFPNFIIYPTALGFLVVANPNANSFQEETHLTISFDCCEFLSFKIHTIHLF